MIWYFSRSYSFPGDIVEQRLAIEDENITYKKSCADIRAAISKALGIPLKSYLKQMKHALASFSAEDGELMAIARSMSETCPKTLQGEQERIMLYVTAVRYSCRLFQFITHVVQVRLGN